MRKQGVLNAIEVMKHESENMERTDENTIILLMKLVDTLLDYNGDPDIRKGVDEILL